MNISKRSWLSLFLTFLFLCGLLFWAKSAQSDDIYSSIQKNLTVLGQIYKEVTGRYVDEIDPDRFLRAGIDGMLNTLDPYTAYIEKDGQHQLQVLTEGKYGGVGLLLNWRNQQLVVGDTPFEGTPSAKAGIREGDIIVKVDSVFAHDVGFDKAAELIRGPEGTKVTLTIHREGESKPLDFTLIREQIMVEDIRYAGFVREGTGYIRLTRFSKNAAPEIIQTLRKFKKKNLKSLILDLRSNPGGTLDAAVNVSDIFLPKDLSIVSTKGRMEGSLYEFNSLREPIAGDIPLIVLVNRFSASASEIVAGAIQDNDRGIIVGDTTFGKGLVQSVIPLSPTTALKITTAKYYSPSGRCIQSRNYSMWTDTSMINSSLVYHTSSGRPVYGGGGIAPDVIVDLPPINNMVIDLRRNSQFYNFAIHYANTHPIPDSSFTVDDEIVHSFRNYLKENSYHFTHPAERGLLLLKEEAEEFGYNASLLDNIKRLETSIELTKDEIFYSNIDDIKFLLKQELTSKFFGSKHSIKISLNEDPVIQKALELLDNPTLYNNILSNKNN